MFQLLKETHIDFMRWARPMLVLSVALVLAAVIVLPLFGLNWGIEFTGGTELQLKYAERPSVQEIRARLEQARLSGPSVTTIGDPGDHEVYIRLAGAADPDDEEDLTGRVVEALRAGTAAPEGRRDLNVIGEPEIARIISAAPGLGPGTAESLTAAVVELRQERAIFHAFDDLAEVPGMTPEVRAHLERETYLGPFAVRSQSYIGPAIGRELMQKALWAILGSMLGMLVYIGFRFQFRWGMAAVAALIHDTLVTLGLFSLFQKEMSLPVVAAFLTLIGYSVNDTVVVFDRIRENLRARPNADLRETINASINQTLSRTIITSGLTWIVCLTLFVFGGSALNAFSFVLTVGVLVGTYSSISIASPILVLIHERAGRRTAAQAAPAGGDRVARKVRRSTSGGA